jgi:hypothetical protein
MKIGLLPIVSVMPVVALADDTLPQRPNFDRYRAMLNHSFAIETVAVPAATSDQKDLYIASVACSGDDCFATLASATDKNFKEHIKVKQTDIQWTAPK